MWEVEKNKCLNLEMLGLFEDGTKMEIPCDILPHLITLNGKKIKIILLSLTFQRTSSLKLDFKPKLDTQCNVSQKAERINFLFHENSSPD